MKVQNKKFYNKPIVFRGVGELTGDSEGVFDLQDEKLVNDLTKVGFTIVAETKVETKSDKPKNSKTKSEIKPELKPEESKEQTVKEQKEDEEPSKEGEEAK